MIKIYVRQITAGKMTVADVPAYWRSGVKAVFDEMLENGEITQDQYDAYMGENGAA